MYTEEGFLHKLINKVLREKQQSLIYQIKYYYASLLAAFDYYSDESMDLLKYYNQIPEKTRKEIEQNKIFYVYRGTHLTREEIEVISNSIEKNTCILRIFNEFFSTSLHEKMWQQLLNGIAH